MENKVTADYLDEEGCLHCGTCGKRKQMKVSLMGFEHVVSCLCEMRGKKPGRNQMRRCSGRSTARQLYQRKSVGLRERRFWEWKFENDNGSNQEDTNCQAVCRKLDRYEEKKCRIAFDGTSWNREKFLCRLYCKCTFGTGRTCHDDKFFQNLK